MARLHSNSELRAEVAAAVRMGIPLSEWTKWDDEDQEWVLAYLEWEASKCPGCGGLLTETTDPSSEDAWVADDPVRCFRCTTLNAKQEHYADHPYRRSQMVWPVTRRHHR